MRKLDREDWLFILVIGTLVSACFWIMLFRGDNEPKFKYGETLEITGGFYEGMSGKVTEFDEDDEYMIDIEGAEHRYIKEEHLARPKDFNFSSGKYTVQFLDDISAKVSTYNLEKIKPDSKFGVGDVVEIIGERLKGTEGVIEEVLYVQEVGSYVYILKVTDLKFTSVREENLKLLYKIPTKTALREIPDEALLSR